MKNTITISMIFILWASELVLAGTGTTGVSVLLKEYEDARAESMGGASVAYVEGPASLFSNPAGLAEMKKWELVSGYCSWFEGMNLYNLAIGIPLPGHSGVVALGFNGFSAGAFDNFSETGEGLSEELKANDILVTAGWASKNLFRGVLAPIKLGGALKFVYSSLPGSSPVSFAMDAGALFRMKLLNYTRYRKAKNFILGVAVRNLGPPAFTQADSIPLPIEFRGGFVWAPILEKNAIVSISTEGHIMSGGGIHMNAGGEVVLYRLLALRIGFGDIGTTAFSVSGGGGVNIEFKNNMSFGADYSLKPVGALGLTHAVSLRYSSKMN